MSDTAANAAAFLTGPFNGSNVPAEGVRLTIKRVKPEKMPNGDESRLCLYFEETGRKLVLGTQANLVALMEEFGTDYTAWVGRQLTLYSVETNFGSKSTRGVRIRDLS